MAIHRRTCLERKTRNSSKFEKSIYPPYFPSGVKLFILSGLFIALYSFSYRDSINGTMNYFKTTCKIKSIDIVRVDVDCKNADGSVFIANMPCVLIYVEAQDEVNEMKLYRNYLEKSWVVENEVNCSYLPYSCQDSPEFVHRILTKHFKKHSPENTKPFACYTMSHSNSSDSLMYIPDGKAYYFSMTMLCLGLLGGIALTFYRLNFNVTCFSTQSSYKSFKKDIYTLNYDSNDPRFNYPLNNDDDDNLSFYSSVEVKLPSYFNNNLTLSDNVSRNLDADEIEDMKRLGYRINRIGYPPSCSKVSIGSKSSSASGSVYTRRSLGMNQDSDLSCSSILIDEECTSRR